MKRAIAVLASLTLVACASEAPSVATPLSAKNGATVCELVYVTGSSLPKNVCRTAQERSEQTAAAQEAAQQMRATMDQRKESPKDD